MRNRKNRPHLLLRGFLGLVLFLATAMYSDHAVSNARRRLQKEAEFQYAPVASGATIGALLGSGIGYFTAPEDEETSEKIDRAAIGGLGGAAVGAISLPLILRAIAGTDRIENPPPPPRPFIDMAPEDIIPEDDSFFWEEIGGPVIYSI